MTAIILIVIFTAGKIAHLRGEPAVTTGQGIPVKTAMVQKGAISSSITYAGIIEPEYITSLSSEVAAPIKTMLVEEGQLVSKGELIAALEGEQYTNKLEIAVKKLESARLTEEYLKKELQRSEILYEKGALAAKSFEEAVYKYDLACASIEEAEAMLKDAQTNVESTNIYAPVNGYVKQIFKYPGDVIVPGQPLLALESIDNMVISANVLQGDLAAIKPGNQVKVTAHNSVFQTSVLKVNKSIDQQTRTAPVKLNLSEDHISEYGFYPGMNVKVDFITDEKSQAILVPREALLTEGDKNYVFLIKDNQAIKQAVETGLKNHKFIEIKSGLNSGQKVCTSSLNKLYDKCTIYQYQDKEDLK